MSCSGREITVRLCGVAVLACTLLILPSTYAFGQSDTGDTPWSVKQLVEYQQGLHRDITGQDVYKLFYQSAFGVGHILGDSSAVRQYLLDELSSVDSIPSGEPLLERIDLADSLVRVNLRPFKRLNLPPEKLVQVMNASGRATLPDSITFYRMWNEFKSLVKYGLLQCDVKVGEMTHQSESDGAIPSVHHSRSYTTANHPAYRVVRRTIFTAVFGDMK
jgi:hypothetical protein